MFGIGPTELFIILVIAFILFGPDKLPQMGRTIGRGIKQFQQAQEEMSKVVKAEIYDPLTDDSPKTKKKSSTAKKIDAKSSESKSDKTEATEKDSKKPESFAERRARLEALKKEASKEDAPATTAEKLYGLAEDKDSSIEVSDDIDLDEDEDLSSQDTTPTSREEDKSEA